MCSNELHYKCHPFSFRDYLEPLNSFQSGCFFSLGSLLRESVDLGPSPKEEAGRLSIGMPFAKTWSPLTKFFFIVLSQGSYSYWCSL